MPQRAPTSRRKASLQRPQSMAETCGAAIDDPAATICRPTAMSATEATDATTRLMAPPECLDVPNATPLRFPL
jgi:hypothetical protein